MKLQWMVWVGDVPAHSPLYAVPSGSGPTPRDALEAYSAHLRAAAGEHASANEITVAALAAIEEAPF